MFLNEQLSSIIPQLRPDDEILIADDGSTDDTLSVLDKFKSCVRVVAANRVGGVVANFERVLTAASGDGIVLCDQDDVWMPGRLALIREGLLRASLIMLNGEVVDGSLNKTGKTVFEAVRMRRGFWRNVVRNSFIGCCMAFRRTLLKRVMPFPAGVPWHDWYIGLVGVATGKVEYIDLPTLLYRRHGANHSPTGERSTNSLAVKVALRFSILRCVTLALSRSEHGHRFMSVRKSGHDV